MDYAVKLSNFEGPLDLLLHLIQKEQIDIKDIFISNITSQYLEYMEQLDELDMDTASEFINVAATIILIKSRSLLPKPPAILDSDEEDPEQLLIRQLTEYKMYKEAGERLKFLMDDASGVYYKLREELFPEENIVLTGLTLKGLLEAYSEVLNKTRIREKIETPREIRSSNYSIKDKLIYIRGRLRREEEIEFSQLFGEAPCVEEVVVTFVALLELIKSETVRAVQETPFGKIILRARRSKEDE